MEFKVARGAVKTLKGQCHEIFDTVPLRDGGWTVGLSLGEVTG